MVNVLGNEMIQEAVESERIRNAFVVEVLEPLIMCLKSWEDMDSGERQACVRAAVLASESEGELLENLDILGMGKEDFSVSWHLSDPGDQTGDEARMLVRALGGLVSKNGALVMIRTAEEEF